MFRKYLIFFLCTFLILLTIFPAGAIDIAPVNLTSFTGMDLFLADVTEENPIVSVRYEANAYEPGPPSCFFITDPLQISDFMEAVAQSKVNGPGFFMTCYYPHFTFTRADGVSFHLHFSHNFLEFNGEYYSLTNDDLFWQLTVQYTKQYMSTREPVSES